MEELRFLLYPLPLGLILVLLGCVLLMLRQRAFGGVLALLGVVPLWLLGTEPVSDRVRANLEHRYPPVAVDELPTADAIVLLGGGVRPPIPPRPVPEFDFQGERVHMAARLYHANRAPRIVSAVGVLPGIGVGPRESEATQALLQTLGVPADAVLLRGDSTTTHEEAVTVRALRDAVGIERVLLVTSALHMPRAVATFTAMGIDVIPAPTAFEIPDSRVPTPSRWIPDAEAFWGSSRAWHEHIGMWHYRYRGWAVSASDMPEPDAWRD